MVKPSIRRRLALGATSVGLASLGTLAVASAVQRSPVAVVDVEDARPAVPAANVPAPSVDRPGLQPKREIGVARFLEANPDYDGRDTVVAIFDTGVDPGAPGLQVCPDGRPKIIDVVDGSGSGDVDTSTVVTPSEDGTVEGLSGRTLTLDPAWTNPSGELRLGLKPAYEIFPSGLVRRLSEERTRADAVPHRRRVGELAEALRRWDDANPSPTAEQMEERTELAARLEQAEALWTSHRDVGPVYDCVVWHDGETWRAAVDTDEDGDLAEESALAPFALEREYATFGERDLLNFAVQVYDDGDTLSIVADVGAHGTHVAGIVAAHFPNQPELDGMAPGAQIVSVKIGDTRLGSSSTGTGEARGVAAVLAHGCDVVNMSYGGARDFPNIGGDADLLTELVNEHGVIFVSSAGNAGPGLTSVGGPGGTTSAIIGVGAAITPSMMEEQYTLRDPGEPMQYTWSSRGPTADGDLGVDISAPGGAIAPVPTWTLQKSMLMNGTSMSSPSAAGGIALLLSGLKAEGIDYGPWSVRRALEATASTIPGTEPWAQGHGMIQVDRAWEHLTTHRYLGDEDAWYSWSIANDDGARGIYLREPWETDRPFVARVSLNVGFPREADRRRLAEFELPLELEATESWVSVGPSVHLMHGGRNFEVAVDPTGLPNGAHYAEVLAFDATRRDRGPVARLPITVTRSTDVHASSDHRWSEGLALEAGQLERRFIEIPIGATWADLMLRRTDGRDEARRLLKVQATQLREHRAYPHRRFDQYISFEGDGEERRSIRVEGGGTLELAIAQFWSSLGDSDFDVELTFRGLTPAGETVVLDGSRHFTPVTVTSHLRKETLSPSVRLDTWRRTLRPVDRTMRALLDPRDTLPEGRHHHELALEYELELSERSRIRFRSGVSELPLVDTDIQSHSFLVFDEHDRWIRTVSAWDDDPFPLDEGTYRVVHHLRDHDRTRLASFEDLAIHVDTRLASPITLGVHAMPPVPTRGAPGFGGRDLLPGEAAVVYVSSPSSMPKAAAPGDHLMGSMRLVGATLVDGATTDPVPWTVVMSVPPKANDIADAPTVADADEDEPSADERLADRLIDAQIAELRARIGDDEADFDGLAESILAARPDHRDVRAAQLDRALKSIDDDPQAVLDAAAALRDTVDEDAVRRLLQPAADPDDAAERTVREELETQRDALVDALVASARAGLHVAADAADGPGGAGAAGAARAAAKAAAERHWRALQPWADAAGDRMQPLVTQRHRVHGHLGQALASVHAAIEDEPTDRDLWEARLDLIEALGWEDLAVQARRDLLVRFPRDRPRL